jgi:hypothetical protein
MDRKGVKGMVSARFVIVNLLGASLALGACTHVEEASLFDEIWRNPDENDQRLFSMTIYPFDLYGDATSYIFCRQPCSEASALSSPNIIFPSLENDYRGMRGKTAVAVSVRFNAVCFYSGVVCPNIHRPFIFVEVGETGE